MPRYHKPLVVNIRPLADEASASLVSPTAWFDRAIFCGMLMLLMFGPLAFGATQPWSQFVQRTVALALLALWLARQYLRRSLQLLENSLNTPVLVFVGLVIYQFVSGRTAYRYATLTQALDLLPCGVLILIVGEVFTRRRRLHDFALAMSVFGLAVAVFALVQDLSSSGKIYWLVKVHGISAAMYGPYANHNHYAGLIEMLVPMAGAVAFLEHGAKRSLVLFASIIMALSIVFSRSRGGMLGLGVAIVFVCAMLFRTTRQHRAAFTILAVAALVGVLVVFLANDKILQRLTETQDSYRLLIYRDCARMWLHKPFLGFGFGTFPIVFPEYRSFFVNLFVNHAHNDYLELLVEMGIAGLTTIGWFLFGVFRHGLHKIFDRNDYEGSVLTLGVLTSIVAMLVHSALDFNLHIPANSALFFTLCSAAATPFKHRLRRSESVPQDLGVTNNCSVVTESDLGTESQIKVCKDLQTKMRKCEFSCCASF